MTSTCRARESERPPRACAGACCSLDRSYSLPACAVLQPALRSRLDNDAPSQQLAALPHASDQGTAPPQRFGDDPPCSDCCLGVALAPASTPAHACAACSRLSRVLCAQAPRVAGQALLPRVAGYSTAPPELQQQPGLTMEMALSISNATQMQLDRGLQGAHLDQIRVRHPQAAPRCADLTRNPN